MKQYLELMRLVRDSGTFKSDRTGTGTYRLVAHQMRFTLADGFPLVTT
jgi:thymidylate synthase